MYISQGGGVPSLKQWAGTPSVHQLRQDCVPQAAAAHRETTEERVKSRARRKAFGHSPAVAFASDNTSYALETLQETLKGRMPNTAHLTSNARVAISTIDIWPSNFPKVDDLVGDVKKVFDSWSTRDDEPRSPCGERNEGARFRPTSSHSATAFV